MITAYMDAAAVASNSHAGRSTRAHSGGSALTVAIEAEVADNRREQQSWQLYKSEQLGEYFRKKTAPMGFDRAEGHGRAAVCECLEIQRRNTSMDGGGDAVQCSTVFSC